MSRVCIQIAWDDVPHLTPEMTRDMLAAMPPHQRDARSKGVPALGSGAIYQVMEDDVVCEPFELPAYFRRCYGLDVGGNPDCPADSWALVDADGKLFGVLGLRIYSRCLTGYHCCQYEKCNR